jgi:hypothetical protein
MKAAPKIVYSCSRRAPRYRVQRAGEAVVDFELPDGAQYRFEIIELSTVGLSFVLGQNHAALQRGSTIHQVVLRVGDKHIKGSLTVVHVTEEFSIGLICGAEFKPATVNDERELAAFMASRTG